MKFTKMHGCGNDYVYVNLFEEKLDDPARVSIYVSDRHFGIGSDGLITIGPSDKADFRMRIYNADGSEAEMCGNGIRCVAKYVYDHKLTDKTEISVETGAGIKYLTLYVEENKVSQVRVDMGEPILTPGDIPVVKADGSAYGDDYRVIDEPISAGNREWHMTCVSMGNPHAVVFVDDVAGFELEKYGPLFENHKMFPKRTNTEFVEILSRNEAKMRVWERGSAETWACGTGTCATVMACILNKKTDNKVLVHLRVTYIKVDDTRLALACMSAAYFDYPAEKIKTIGITGTKGKTTTTYMVKSILESAGIKTGLIGTIESICGDRRIPSANTTPESYRVQELFKEMVDEGLDAVVMEVSSQALMLHRVSGFTFDIGVFTNLEPDHIGEHEHKDFADYMHCKSLLFRQCRLGIFNGDDEHLEGIMNGHTCQVETYGYKSTNNLVAENVELKKEHGALGIKYHVSGLLDFDVEVNVPGKFSVYNSLTAIAICHHFNVDKKAIGEALHHVSVKGRIEIVPVTKRYTLMIDYAHNAMALESLLTTLKEYEPGRLVCLFGCGGNRAKSRRYEMGEVSSRLADLTVVTSDNPRDEEPMDIINDILQGVHKADGEYVTIPDRKEAIRYCMENAKDGDIIVLAGKGHEDYQEIKGVKHHMDERELIADIIKENPDIRL